MPRQPKAITGPAPDPAPEETTAGSSPAAPDAAADNTKSIRFREAPDVAALCAELIEEKPYHQHLREWKPRIVYLFDTRDKAPTCHGKPALAIARKITSLNAFLAGKDDPAYQDSPDGPPPFFVIQVWQAGWRMLKAEQKRYVADHELYHCVVGLSEKGIVKYSIRGHDIEDFTEIVAHHGLIMPNVEAFVRAAERGPNLFSTSPENGVGGDAAPSAGRWNGSEADFGDVDASRPDPMNALTLLSGTMTGREPRALPAPVIADGQELAEVSHAA